jgi:hypothetical protein
MKNQIEISTGAHGFFLSINGKAIKQNPNGLIEATETLKANAWIATEFSSLQSLRNFWANYRLLILHITKNQ